MNDLPTIRVVIINWNAGPLLRSCLNSLAATDKSNFTVESVVVVDNASQDGSADGLLIDGLPVRTIRNPLNRGFAAACNQGAAGSNASFLLFLNPDTRLEAQSLDTLIAAAQSHPESGIFGTSLTDAAGIVRRSCARFPSPWRLIGQALGLDRLAPDLVLPHFMSDWDHGQSREVDQVMGAVFLVRRPLFEALRGFDERFFVYYEEVDFSLRAKQTGASTRFVTEAQVFHAERGTTDRIPAIRLVYFLRSRLAYFGKHFGAMGLFLAYLATYVIEPVTRLLWSILKRQDIRPLLETYRLLLIMRSRGGAI